MIMVMISMMMMTETVIMITVVEMITNETLTTIIKMMFKLGPMCGNSLEMQKKKKRCSQSYLPPLEYLAVCVLQFHCAQQCRQISKPSFQYHCLMVLCLDYISLWQVQHPMHLSVNKKGKRSG